MSQEIGAIAGVGSTEEFGKFPERTRLSLLQEGLENAMEDAGIDRNDLDGFITHSSPPTSWNYDQLIPALGLDVNHAEQFWAHGRWHTNAIHNAAAAVKNGIANYVACGVGFRSSAKTFGGTDQHGDRICLTETAHAERPWYGMTAPGSGSALATRKYMERYGATSEDLAHVPVSLSRHASLNPKAQYKDQITVEEHQDSRWIIEPLKLYDFPAVTDGAVFVIVTSEELAKSGPNKPVRIAGIEGHHADRKHMSTLPFSRPGLGVRNQLEYDYDASQNEDVQRIYDRAGVTRDDIDAFYCYDAFSSTIWFALENWGFCEAGEAYKFTRDGNIEIDGELPVNTSGGLTQEGHLHGWNNIIEGYNQLQGRCGKRQLDDVDTVQWANATHSDSMILTRY